MGKQGPQQGKATKEHHPAPKKGGVEIARIASTSAIRASAVCPEGKSWTSNEGFNVEHKKLIIAHVKVKVAAAELCDSYGNTMLTLDANTRVNVQADNPQIAGRVYVWGHDGTGLDAAAALKGFHDFSGGSFFAFLEGPSANQMQLVSLKWKSISRSPKDETVESESTGQAIRRVFFNDDSGTVHAHDGPMPDGKSMQLEVQIPSSAPDKWETIETKDVTSHSSLLSMFRGGIDMKDHSGVTAICLKLTRQYRQLEFSGYVQKKWLDWSETRIGEMPKSFKKNGRQLTNGTLKDYLELGGRAGRKEHKKRETWMRGKAYAEWKLAPESIPEDGNAKIFFLGFRKVSRGKYVNVDPSSTCRPINDFADRFGNKHIYLLWNAPNRASGGAVFSVLKHGKTFTQAKIEPIHVDVYANVGPPDHYDKVGKACFICGSSKVGLKNKKKKTFTGWLLARVCIEPFRKLKAELILTGPPGADGKPGEAQSVVLNSTGPFSRLIAHVEKPAAVASLALLIDAQGTKFDQPSNPTRTVSVELWGPEKKWQVAWKGDNLSSFTTQNLLGTSTGVTRIRLSAGWLDENGQFRTAYYMVKDGKKINTRI